MFLQEAVIFTLKFHVVTIAGWFLEAYQSVVGGRTT